MHQAELNAIHKHSSATYSELVHFDSPNQLEELWDSFCKSVPFTRWYANNTYYGNDEEMKSIVEEEMF